MFGNCTISLEKQNNKKQHRSGNQKAACAYLISKFYLEIRIIIYLIKVVCLHDNKHVVESNLLQASENNHLIWQNLCMSWTLDHPNFGRISLTVNPKEWLWNAHHNCKGTNGFGILDTVVNDTIYSTLLKEINPTLVWRIPNHSP